MPGIHVLNNRRSDEFETIIYDIQSLALKGERPTPLMDVVNIPYVYVPHPFIEDWLFDRGLNYKVIRLTSALMTLLSRKKVVTIRRTEFGPGRPITNEDLLLTIKELRCIFCDAGELLILNGYPTSKVWTVYTYSQPIIVDWLKKRRFHKCPSKTLMTINAKKMRYLLFLLNINKEIVISLQELKRLFKITKGMSYARAMEVFNEVIDSYNANSKNDKFVLERKGKEFVFKREGLDDDSYGESIEGGPSASGDSCE